MRTFASIRTFAVSAAAAALALVAVPATHAQIYSNNAAISIPSSGAATPYPSTINVSGFVGTPRGLRVRLKNLNHQFVGDVAVLLVAPSGQGIELLSRNGFSLAVSGLTLTFGAESTTPLPLSLVTGSFRPAGGSYAFPAPADAIPRVASLGALMTGSPNGQWRLFVQDLVNLGSGSIAGGWELEFGDFGVAPTPSSPSTFTYQGRLDGGVTTGTIDVRFSLWSHPSLNVAFNRLAAPVTVSGIAVTNGLFTTPVDLGVPVPSDVQTWLQVEIASPAGEPFVTLTPRQPITATPLASAAVWAELADFATNAAAATTATTATTATNATNAINATNAASVPWSGLTGQAEVTTGSLGASNWQMLLTNTTNTTFRGGMRLSNSGFFEVTNSANNANPGFARLSSNANWTFVSDARMKTDVTSAEGNLAAAMKLRPVNFRWKGDGAQDFGLIAQEVREVLPRLVTGDETNDTLTLNYSQLSVVAIGAIQELKADNDRKQREIDVLRARLERLEEALGTEPAIRKP